MNVQADTYSTFTASNIHPEKITEVLEALNILGMMPIEATFSIMPKRNANFVPEEDCEQHGGEPAVVTSTKAVLKRQREAAEQWARKDRE
jgi:hypothetical protein